MGILETMRLAIDGIWLNKMRSLLTMLGMGSKKSVDNQFSSMSVTIGAVRPVNIPDKLLISIGRSIRLSA